MVEIFSNNYVRIIGSTLAVYLFIIIAIRLFGKKELAQLSVVDLVFILLISNAVQNAMVGPDATLTGGLVAAFTLFVVNHLLKYLQFRFPEFRKVVEGETIMLVYKGKTLKPNLRKACITEDELMEAAREHGVAAISEIGLAILEVDGNISILSDQYLKKSVKEFSTHKKVSKKVS
ncbi:MAG: YetF domain-containing protein [Bacteroidota bacterium]